MGGHPRVALLIESSRASGRGLLSGIAEYLRSHGPWIIFHRERALVDAAPQSLFKWGADGIIARIESRRLIRQIRRLALPTVDVLGWHAVPGVPRMGNDRDAVVRMAVDHLGDRGLVRLAYCGFCGLRFSEERAEAMVRYGQRLGFPVEVYQGRSARRPADVASIEARGLLRERSLAAWLRSLAKPVGLVACNDACAHQVLSVCCDVGIHVPGQVAVVGVDNDEVLCELSYPPLSSIRLNNERIGYEAAALLSRMLRGERLPADEIRLPPVGVVARRSTDTFVTDDPDVAAAVRWIEEHACDGIGAADILEQVALSSSTLKRRFARYLGHSPKQHVLQAQCNRAKELLAGTSLRVHQVAGKCGFPNVEWFCKWFKRTTGHSPSQWRDQVRGKASR